MSTAGAPVDTRVYIMIIITHHFLLFFFPINFTRSSGPDRLVCHASVTILIKPITIIFNNVNQIDFYSHAMYSCFTEKKNNLVLFFPIAPVARCHFVFNEPKLRTRCLIRVLCSSYILMVYLCYYIYIDSHYCRDQVHSAAVTVAVMFTRIRCYYSLYIYI